ncbi:thiol-disulfide isomerase/thioredoxin [Metabacillus crassostreae]|uniref:TlpA family protein disulfide reductase n=1 Tax=Metabacillus crassostreae TaxID=929098 RepID=UPI0019570269|nr:redoxin domain-containing protein [Metabacillus crassostreae]MBM7603100.1 thiol-disulfide isomerase/thioredoxin [Metabacillus crassostreae]
MKKILAISILVFLIGYAIYNTVMPSNAKVGVTEGNAAPDFELTTLDGEKMSLSDLKGKKVLVNFWATWCPPCRSEMPDMQQIYDEYDDDVVIAAVNLTSSESSIDTVESFVNELSLTFPILLDEKGKVNNEYEVLSYPTSYFIDEEGIIKTKFVGALSYDQMKKLIDDM